MLNLIKKNFLAKERERKEVSILTSLLVLGLLKLNGPMSGYDIQTAMESTQTDMWAYVQPASIYYALKKLEKKGFVDFDEFLQTGNRSKALYKITEKGKEEYTKLIKESMDTLSVAFPTNLYTALTFIDDLPIEEIRKSIDEQLVKITKLHDEMKAIEVLKKNLNAFPKNVEMIFTNIYKQCEIQLDLFIEMRDYYSEESTPT